MHRENRQSCLHIYTNRQFLTVWKSINYYKYTIIFLFLFSMSLLIQISWTHDISAALQLHPLALFAPWVSLAVNPAQNPKYMPFDLFHFLQIGWYRVESLSHCSGTMQEFTLNWTSLILSLAQVILVLTVCNYCVLNHKKKEDAPGLNLNCICAINLCHPFLCPQF